MRSGIRRKSTSSSECDTCTVRNAHTLCASCSSAYQMKMYLSSMEPTRNAENATQARNSHRDQVRSSPNRLIRGRVVEQEARERWKSHAQCIAAQGNAWLPVTYHLGFAVSTAAREPSAILFRCLSSPSRSTLPLCRCARDHRR